MNATRQPSSEYCQAIVTAKDGDHRPCRLSPVNGSRFCPHHQDVLSPELARVWRLILRYGWQFFTPEIQAKAWRMVGEGKPRGALDARLLKKVGPFAGAKYRGAIPAADT